MDRIPTTNEGAVGGSRDAATGPMAGSLLGRFGERRVSVTTETPRPLRGQGHEAGSDVASVARPGVIRYARAIEVAPSSGLSGATDTPQRRRGLIGAAGQAPLAARPPSGPRAGQGPSGAAPFSVIERSVASSGASATGVVLGRWRNPLAVSLKRSDERYWEKFVHWCKERNVPHCPASAATVADYLRNQAERSSVKTLSAIRTAVAKVHRAAGFADPADSVVVKAAFRELVKAKGGVTSQSTNIHGRSLDATELDAIRGAAIQPRQHGSGSDWSDQTAQRGRVTLALCSLVLEAGLGCDEAAALEWRDVTGGGNDAPEVTIRKGTAEPDDVVEISVRAFEDLKNIAPKHAEQDAKIFAISARQIAVYIRKAAQGADLEGRIEGRGSAAAPSLLNAGSVRVNASYWRRFSAWCDRRGLENLPASPETVAEYLREESRTIRVHSLEGIRCAIRDAHLRSGYENPCSSPIVHSVFEEVRRANPKFTVKSLDAAALEAIRQSAMRPRHSRRSQESCETARVRGLFDIALCSVLYATGLTVKQVLALKWGDVAIPGAGRARLTLASGSDSGDSSEIREIAGDVVRDLEAIRGASLPEDSVFPFGISAVYRRVESAARAAGLSVATTEGGIATCHGGLIAHCHGWPTAHCRGGPIEQFLG